MAHRNPTERFVIVHADPLIGRTVAGRFRVQALVARGATGRVYRCEQLGLRRPIALKILDATGGNFDGDAARQRFAQEAEALARLTHENTVRVVDAGQWEGIDYLAMEFVAGQTLKQRLERGALPPALALSVARQICGSLAEAHGAGLVHRDLKPGNVLLTRKDDGGVGVKVVDFGLVKQLGGALDATLVGRIVGSPLYMAPEQIRGGAVDGRTDLYALGGLLFHMLTGRRPFTQDTTASVLMAHLMAPAPGLADAAPLLRLPPALDRATLRCLAKDPLQRFQSAADCDAALAHCARVLDGSLPWTAPLPGGALPSEFRIAPPPALSQPLPAARPRRHRIPLALGLLAASAILVLGVGAGIGLSQSQPQLPRPDGLLSQRQPSGMSEALLLAESPVEVEAPAAPSPAPEVRPTSPTTKSQTSSSPQEPTTLGAAVGPVAPEWGGPLPDQRVAANSSASPWGP